MSAQPWQLPWRWLGRVDYAAGTAEQERLRERLLSGDASAARLLLLEHEPVITLGKHAKTSDLLIDPGELARRGIALSRANRGGDVTYHGPGQLVIYPVVRLRGSVVRFLETVAGALARVADQLGVPGARWQRDPTGLWLEGSKLAACGIHLRRRVTGHGFAFNVATPPEPWQLIVPCGMPACRVTSIAEARSAAGLPPPPPVARVAEIAAPILCAALADVSESPR